VQLGLGVLVSIFGIHYLNPVDNSLLSTRFNSDLAGIISHVTINQAVKTQIQKSILARTTRRDDWLLYSNSFEWNLIARTLSQFVSSCCETKRSRCRAYLLNKFPIWLHILNWCNQIVDWCLIKDLDFGKFTVRWARSRLRILTKRHSCGGEACFLGFNLHRLCHFWSLVSLPRIWPKLL